MIPKIIHYIWLGKNELPFSFNENIEKAKKIMPDFEIRIWKDEDCKEYLSNDIPFVRLAVEKKAYAFLSDYLRLKILYDYGGIYMDTDVECFKSFKRFLKYDCFLCYIVDCCLGTAVIGSKKNNGELLRWIDYCLSCFDDTKSFQANNFWMTNFFLNNYKDFVLNGKTKKLRNGIAIFKKTYFESKKPFYILGGGYSFHKCAGSWIENKNPPNPNNETKKKKCFLIEFLHREYENHLNYRLHIMENRKYPFYSLFLQQRNKF